MTVRNLEKMFRPRSVALVGASEREGSVGHAIVRNLLGGGFAGDLYLINPRHERIFGQAAWPDFASLPAAPDLAVVATPPDTIAPIVQAAADKGTRAVVVVTAGFGEGNDSDGQVRGQTLLDIANPHLLRIVGPNCVGLIVPPLGLNASFAPGQVLAGDLAFVSQSGAVITAAADWATDRGIGFSHMISMGDMLDVDFGDVLDYLAQDASTKAVLLYIEAIVHSRKFMSAARALARSKPVIVMKSGRHEEGARAAASHTGALAGADQVYDAAFRRAGLIRVHTMDEMFDAVESLALARRPRNDRLAILSNGGGVGVLATDTLIDQGGRLADLAPETIAALDRVLPSTWSRNNPVDIIGDAGGDRYAAALDAIADDPGVGAVLVLNAPTALASSEEAARAVIASRAAKKLPLLTSWLGGARARAAEALFTEAGLPTYDSPSKAVRAFMHLVEYRRRREALMQTPPLLANGLPPDREAVRAILQAVAEDGRTVLTEPESKAVLDAYHIPVGETRVAADTDEAVTAAAAIGFPVALKILSRDITHKSDAGGVALDLADEEQVREAATRMLARVAETFPDARIDGFAVQEMIRRKGAHELILGASTDRQFGPVLMFGQGGTAAEEVGDTAMALPPLNTLLAHEVMRRTRIYRLLRGYRDRPPADRDAITLALLRISQLVADFGAIAELDINPLLADQDGVVALDARIILAAGADPAAIGTEEQGSRFAIRPYPSDLEGEVELDGRRLFLRPIRPEDEPILVEGFRSLSPEDVRLRFFGVIKTLNHEMAARLTQIDYDREMAFVLFDPAERQEGDPPEGSPGGIGRMAADPDFDTAEFALTVRSDRQGRGYGRVLLSRLIEHARRRGIRELFGITLADNRGMLRLAAHLGFTVAHDPAETGVYRLSMLLDGSGGDSSETKAATGDAAADQAALSSA